MLKGNLALCRSRKESRRRLFCLLRFIENLKNTFHACKCRLNLGRQLGYLGQRVVDLPNVTDKCLQVAHRQRAGQDGKAADHRNNADA